MTLIPRIYYSVRRYYMRSWVFSSWPAGYFVQKSCNEYREVCHVAIKAWHCTGYGLLLNNCEAQFLWMCLESCHIWHAAKCKQARWCLHINICVCALTHTNTVSFSECLCGARQLCVYSGASSTCPGLPGTT